MRRPAVITAIVFGVFFVLGVSAFFCLLISALIVLFVVYYRRRSDDERPKAPKHTNGLEIAWSIPPAVIVMVFFVWGAKLYVEAYTPPESAIE